MKHTKNLDNTIYNTINRDKQHTNMFYHLQNKERVYTEIRFYLTNANMIVVTNSFGDIIFKCANGGKLFNTLYNAYLSLFNICN